MKERLKIGTYQLGWRWVDVYADPNETGGYFSVMPGDEFDRAVISVGFDYDYRAEVWGIFVHEAMEFIIDEIGCRFAPTSKFKRTSSDVFRFQLTHDEFTDACFKLGLLIHNIQEDFNAAWSLLHLKD